MGDEIRTPKTLTQFARIKLLNDENWLVASHNPLIIFRICTLMNP